MITAGEPIGDSNAEQARIQSAVEAQYSFAFDDVKDSLVRRLARRSRVQWESKLRRSKVPTLRSFLVSTAARVERNIKGLHEVIVNKESGWLRAAALELTD